MPDKEEKQKDMDQFCVGEEKDVVNAGQDVLFQNTGTTIQMFKFGCKFLLLISSFIYLNVGRILEFISTCFFTLFSWLSWFGW